MYILSIISTPKLANAITLGSIAPRRIANNNYTIMFILQSLECSIYNYLFHKHSTVAQHCLKQTYSSY